MNKKDLSERDICTKFITPAVVAAGWDVVSQIKVGNKGQAFVIDGRGRLIAHPDISLVLRNTDLSRLDYVSKARNADGASTEAVEIVQDVQGREVLTAHAPILPLRWLMFVELPIDEAYAPLYESIKRSSYLLLGGLTLAFLAGLFLARKMIVPIQPQSDSTAPSAAGSGSSPPRILRLSGTLNGRRRSGSLNRSLQTERCASVNAISAP